MRTTFWGILWGTWLVLLNLSTVFGVDGGLEVKEWQVEGGQREGLIWLPKSDAQALRKAPVVLVYHGHGGNMQHAARSFDLHRHWPEAVVIYPQGVKTPGKITDP